jgi:hypothetical protein
MKTIEERIAENVEPLNDCLIWTGYKTAGGYAHMSVDGRKRYIHRLVLEMANGPLPAGVVVDHKCRNTACVKLEHLQAVTVKQNQENLSRHGRGGSGHRGVSWCAQTRTWKVRVHHDGRAYWGGRHASLDAAGAAAVALRDRLFTNNLDDH